MSVYDHRCADCQVCPSCGRVAWCESDRILVVPCEHHGYCGECNVTECRACRERAMFESGQYDPEADPLVVRPVESDADYRERTQLRGFDTTSNGYRRDAS